MSEDIKEIEKIENEIELSVEEREKLRDFLKENLEIIIKNEENKDNENKNLPEKIKGIKFYEKLKVFCETDIKSATPDTKYPKRLAFKHSYLDKKVGVLSSFATKNNPSLENSIYPVFYLYTTEDDKRKYIILAFGYWADKKNKSPISWDKRLSQSFFCIDDYFQDKKEYDIRECFKRSVGNNLPTHKEAILYSAYLIENGLENHIDKMVDDLKKILKYYISYMELYNNYKNNKEELNEKDLKEVLEYYMEHSQDLSQKEKYKKDREEYDKIFFNFINEGFNFPLNTILYGNSEIEKNYVIYSVGIIERNKIISKEKSKENIDIDVYKEITSFNDYKNILEKFETYKENGKIKFIASNVSYTHEEFKKFCAEVEKDKYNNNYILILDNIDGSDMLKIFGDDYSELEKRVCNKEESKLPKNLYILGTTSKTLLSVEFFKDFNFIKAYSKDEIKEHIVKIDEEIENLLDVKEEENNFKFPLNTILYGPPGTGKTYNSILYSLGIATKKEDIINGIKNNTETISDEKINEFNYLKEQGQIEFVTFHQSYSYEDFVEGIRPTLEENIGQDKNKILEKENNETEKELKYTLYSGIFKNICKRAESNLDKNYVLIIDEINRGNISKIFGELITLLEPTKRLGEAEELKIRLPYSCKEFGVPKNLYILGTMNTADRSIALLDIALRRRFNFIEMPPRYNLLEREIENINLKKLLEAINTRIEFLLDKDHLIGHSYFVKVEIFDDLKEVFRNSIMPLLQEYFYDDFEKIKFVLNIKDNKENNFIIKKEKIKSEYIPEVLPEKFLKSIQNKTVYEINEEAFDEDENYRDIYKNTKIEEGK